MIKAYFHMIKAHHLLKHKSYAFIWLKHNFVKIQISIQHVWGLRVHSLPGDSNASSPRATFYKVKSCAIGDAAFGLRHILSIYNEHIRFTKGTKSVRKHKGHPGKERDFHLFSAPFSLPQTWQLVLKGGLERDGSVHVLPLPAVVRVRISGQGFETESGFQFLLF